MANSWLQNISRQKGSIREQKANKGESYSGSIATNGLNSALELPPLPDQDKGFFPSQHFIPGWSGNSLFSKSAMAIKKLQENLWEDAQFRFQNSDNLPHTLCRAIHNEFLNFRSQSKTLKDNDPLNNHEGFWKEIKNPNSSRKDELDSFIELYSFKVATHYLFKLKFLVSFSRLDKFQYNRNHIINPSTFFNQLFKKGSSHEIICEAFKMNQFSWYRPSPHLADKLEKLAQNFHEVSITQMMKISSFRNFRNSSKSLNFGYQNYSHALSHRAFGQFLNQLLIFFPIWQNQEKFSYPIRSHVKKPAIFNTKFAGEHTESLSQSHWLAQEYNMGFSWSEILCPDFSPGTSQQDSYLKHNQELQFLTFLVQYSQGKNINGRELIRRITKEKYQKSRDSQLGQFSLFNSRQLAYDRIILNVSKLPKKNPHHYLINQIQSQKEQLTDNGQLLVLTNQKLFVPSQSKKVSTLMKDFYVDGFFNFEKLKGRGEITHYIYVLRKRDEYSVPSQDLFSMDPQSLAQSSNKPETCFSFRWVGELTVFSQFEELVMELNQFFKKRSSFNTSMYQRSLNHDLSFEFHQDAILDGKLLSSLNSESDNIFHPQFFKSLTKNCTPMEKFFAIQELTDNTPQRLTSDLLGIKKDLGHHASYILIVDYREIATPDIEICTFEAYPAKREEYGDAFFQYFKITPKIKYLNLNLLREYFSSELGRQIIQMCLSGTATKLRGRLRSLLIPRYLANGVDLKESELESSRFLSITEKELLNYRPDEFLNFFYEETHKLEESLEDLKEGQAWAYLSLLGHFKSVLSKACDKVNNRQDNQINFNNPLVVDALMNLETYSIYPNEEVYTELLIKDKSDLERSLTATRFVDGPECALEVYHRQEVLIKFHGEKETLLFINFVLSKAINYSLLEVLQGLEIPKHHELAQVLKSTTSIQETLNEVLQSVKTAIKAKMTKEIGQA